MDGMSPVGMILLMAYGKGFLGLVGFTLHRKSNGIVTYQIKWPHGITFLSNHHLPRKQVLVEHDFMEVEEALAIIYHWL